MRAHRDGVGQLALLADYAELRSQGLSECKRPASLLSAETTRLGAAATEVFSMDELGDVPMHRDRARELDSIAGSELLEVVGCDYKLETRGHSNAAVTSVDLDDDLSNSLSSGKLGDGIAGLCQRKARRYAWSQLAALIPL